MTPQKIRVLIVDDFADTRESIAKLLYFERDIEVVGSAGSGPQGIQTAKDLKPDVILMDINMPGMDGIAATEAIYARASRMRSDHDVGTGRARLSPPCHACRSARIPDEALHRR